MRNNLQIIIVAVSFVLFSVPFSFAKYKMGEKKPLSSRENKATIQTGKKEIAIRSEDDVLKALSVRFDVPVDRLSYYRDLQHGYEEIVPSLIISREAQVEVGKILKARMDGQSWKEISQEYSIDLKPLNNEVLEILKPIRSIVSKTALTERPKNRK
jgi:hypothetical protein